MLESKRQDLNSHSLILYEKKKKQVFLKLKIRNFNANVNSVSLYGTDEKAAKLIE